MEHYDNEEINFNIDSEYTSPSNQHEKPEQDSHTISISSAKENIAGIRNYFLTGLVVILPLAST